MTARKKAVDKSITASNALDDLVASEDRAVALIHLADAAKAHAEASRAHAESLSAIAMAIGVSAIGSQVKP